MNDKALQNSLSLLETLIDTIPNPVFYKDRQGIYRGCNEAFANQIIGVTKERIIGCSLFDLPDAIPTDLAEIYHRKDLELIENPGTQFYEAQVRCSDGQRRDFLFNKATYTDASGAAVGMIGVMVDITDRKQAEEQRNNLIAKLQKALSEVKTLRGFLPICSHCKKIRDDKGYWNQIESYIRYHSEAEFSHGICPECAKKYYPDMECYDEDEFKGPLSHS